MILARKDTFTAIDFETTGVVQDYRNEPWQIGMVELKNGSIKVRRKYNKLIKVGDRPFNNYAPGRHQELRRKIIRAKTLPEQWEKIAPMLEGRTLIAHNTGTERRMLAQGFAMHKFGPWIDTLTLTRIAYPNLPDHKLENLIDYLNIRTRVETICPGLEPHDAYFDAVASAAILEKLLAIPSWKNVTTEALIQAR